MIILRQKEYARADYEGLNFLKRTVLKQRRNDMAKRMTNNYRIDKLGRLAFKFPRHESLPIIRSESQRSRELVRNMKNSEAIGELLGNTNTKIKPALVTAGCIGTGIGLADITMKKLNKKSDQSKKEK